MAKSATADLLPPPGAGPPLGAASPAFLLAQVGAQAAAQFAERLIPLGLAPAHAGLLRLVHASEGQSQQTLCVKLGIAPSRLVALVDDLEQRGLVVRSDHPRDRRSYAVYLTDDGRNALKSIGRIAREHQDVLCAALNADERVQLASLLTRIANQQGLTAGVHPGLGRIRD